MATSIPSRRLAFALACLIQAVVAALLPGAMTAGCCHSSTPAVESSTISGCHMAMNLPNTAPVHSASTTPEPMNHQGPPPSLLRHAQVLDVASPFERTVAATAHSPRNQMSHGSACVAPDVGLQTFLSTYLI